MRHQWLYLHSIPQLVNNLRLHWDKRIYNNINEHNILNIYLQLNNNDDGYDNQHVLELYEYDLNYDHDYEFQH